MEVTYLFNLTEIGKRIKDIREEKKDSQKSLGEKLGKGSPQQSVSQYEKGKNLTIEVLVEISKIYNVSLDFLVLGSDKVDDIELSKEIKELIGTYNRLPNDKKIISRGLLKVLDEVVENEAKNE